MSEILNLSRRDLLHAGLLAGGGLVLGLHLPSLAKGQAGKKGEVLCRQVVACMGDAHGRPPVEEVAFEVERHELVGLRHAAETTARTTVTKIFLFMVCRIETAAFDAHAT